ncbi:hypothetical protein [Sandaracinus amylolyticus]|uniref:Uncharacterized protein n=1 Tax=Sandaracinus amylolyticus TaxID=927083 RepID=A0A0F6VZD0_9BACT|nr:hypothetical protein [Sandaracinus amylolyticus]AKF03500.1 hypothetical protein DB32_000649 [Sandaracinus amylolyticus]
MLPVFPARIEHVEAAFGCGVVGPVGVVLWRGEPTAERLERATLVFERATNDLARYAMFAVWEPGSPPPNVAHLPEIARRFDGLDRLRATVGIIEDRGPLARMLVDVASTIFVMRRRRGQPLKLCTDLAEGASWVARRVDEPPQLADAVIALVQRLRTSLP